MWTDLIQIRALFSQINEGFRLLHSGRLPKYYFFFFYVLPLAIALVFYFCSPDQRAFEKDLLVVLSIYLGFLISMFVPFFNLIDKNKSETQPENPNAIRQRERMALYRVLFSHIALGVFLSICSLAAIIWLGQLEAWLGEHVIFSLSDIELHTGKYMNIFVRVFGYYCVVLGVFNLLKILLVSNSLISSDLPKK